jgi:SOS-response transcriptional repressor LexA
MKSIEEIRRENLSSLIAARCGGNESEASRVLEYDRPTMVNHWTSGRKNMSTPSARKVEEKFSLPAFWMDVEHSPRDWKGLTTAKHKTGTDDASINTQKGSLIKELPTTGRNSLMSEGQKKFDQNVAPAQVGQRRIPIISYVQAGMMTEAMDPFALGEGLETVVTDLDVSDGTFGLRIKGESMLPEFRENDVIIVDPAEQPRPGDFVVAKNSEEEATFKKYRPRGTNERGEMIFELVPLNDDFPMLHSERDHLIVIGVMVEHRKYRKR